LTSRAIGERMVAELIPTRPAFFLRLCAGIVDLMILGVPLACFISFLSVGMGISTAFLALEPGKTPHDLLLRFGPRFIYITLAFFVGMSWAYFAGCESAKWQATPGKKFFGLIVTDESGSRPTFWRASLRFLFGRALFHVPYIGFYYVLIDCGRVAFSRDGRAFHDLLSGCLVKRSYVELKLN
jgi:uncharacterized RDD family membrane protein YckC